MRALEEAARVRLQPPEGTSRDAVLTGPKTGCSPPMVLGSTAVRVLVRVQYSGYPQPVCSTLDSVGTGVLQ
jgi:hypothetical protein